MCIVYRKFEIKKKCLKLMKLVIKQGDSGLVHQYLFYIIHSSCACSPPHFHNMHELHEIVS